MHRTVASVGGRCIRPGQVVEVVPLQCLLAEVAVAHAAVAAEHHHRSLLSRLLVERWLMMLLVPVCQIAAALVELVVVVALVEPGYHWVVPGGHAGCCETAHRK